MIAPLSSRHVQIRPRSCPKIPRSSPSSFTARTRAGLVRGRIACPRNTSTVVVARYLSLPKLKLITRIPDRMDQQSEGQRQTRRSCSGDLGVVAKNDTSGQVVHRCPPLGSRHHRCPRRNDVGRTGGVLITIVAANAGFNRHDVAAGTCSCRLKVHKVDVGRGSPKTIS